jgi:hypothetical protein
MGFLEANLGALSKIEPKLAQRLIHVQDNQRVCVGEDGGLTVTRDDGESVFFPGFKSFQSIPKLSGYGHLKDSDVVIVYGFGVGVHVRELIQATSPKTFILVIDPAVDLFLHALKLSDLSDLFSGKRVSLAIGEDPYQATRVRLENFFGVFTLKNIKVFQCPPSIQLAPDYFEKVNSCVKEITYLAERNRNTLSRFSGIWHHNILENLPEILKNPGILQLSDKFAGKPGIIISAGPSLDKNVKWLAAYKGRAVLICVDTALKTLLKVGIVPDFLVCLDALAMNYMHVALEKNDDICLVANPVTFPQILKKHKGKIFMMTFNDPLMGWIEKSIGEKGNAITGGSVATAAFDFARQIGASPIFLVGQDLALTGKRAYTNGSFYCENWMDMYDGSRGLQDYQELKIQEEPTVEDKDFFGKPTLTTSKMISWKKWFEAMLSQKDVRCIHATEGGLFIQGSEMSPLREALMNNCGKEFDVARILEEVVYQPEDGALDDLLARIKGLNKKVERIERVCKEGMALATGLLAHTRKQGPDRQRLQNGMTRLGTIASNILSENEFLELNKWSIDVLIEKMQEYKTKSKDGPIQTSLYSYKILLGGIETLSKMLGRKLDESISFLKREAASLKGS